MQKRFTFKLIAACALMTGATASFFQETIKIANIVQSNADGVFAYSSEEESARILRELRKQGWTKPIIGETTLTGQKVIELAGEAANGAVAHVGLTVDAPLPAIRAFRAKFES